MFDQYASLAALEQVVNVAKEKADDRATKFIIILRQCRPLANSSALQTVLTKLVATKEEVEVAKVVEKALKNVSQARYGTAGPPYLSSSAPTGCRGANQISLGALSGAASVESLAT